MTWDNDGRATFSYGEERIAGQAQWTACLFPRSVMLGLQFCDSIVLNVAQMYFGRSFPGSAPI
jgi:hypothetical protein